MADRDLGALPGPSAATQTVVLASGSRFRAKMLRDAGVPFTVDVPGVDEASVRDSLQAENATAGDAATLLAELKAVAVSRKHPDALVIGSDQMLDCNGIWFEKPQDRAHAQATLTALSGKTHRLLTAAVVAKGGSRIWHTIDTVTMRMRPLSADFIDQYLDAMGDDVSSSVGAYQLEGLGAQLFAGVEGDFFTVLGLPLLPLLDFLRSHGVLAR
jgi:septum formation protein